MTNYAGMRRPLHHAEDSAYYNAQDQGVKVRAKRNPNNLPCSFTAGSVSCYKNRNWKSKRKKQYK